MSFEKAYDAAERRLHELGLTGGPSIDDGLTEKGRRVAGPVLRHIAEDKDFWDLAEREKGNDQAVMLYQYIGEMKPRPRSYNLNNLEWALLLLVPFLEAMRISQRIEIGMTMTGRTAT